jgi:hypothetical protein
MRSWDGPRRMSTRSPAGERNDRQVYDVHGAGKRTDAAEDARDILATGSGNTIHIHMNCGGREGGCGGSYDAYATSYPALVPTLPGLWPLAPASYGCAGFPPGFVFGCPPGPVLLPPLAVAQPGWSPTGW